MAESIGRRVAPQIRPPAAGRQAGAILRQAFAVVHATQSREACCGRVAQLVEQVTLNH